jgi:hypothetical protein
MTYIRLFKLAYIALIFLNFVIILRKGTAFGVVHYFINFFAILINVFTFIWLKNKISLQIEKSLSLLRLSIIILNVFIYPLAILIYILPTSDVLWLPILGISKIITPDSFFQFMVIWFFCSILFVLEIVFFKKLSHVGWLGRTG